MTAAALAYGWLLLIAWANALERRPCLQQGPIDREVILGDELLTGQSYALHPAAAKQRSMKPDFASVYPSRSAPRRSASSRLRRAYSLATPG